jgi:tetraacyldisaccharide-1-P 4'-kinase
MRADWTRLVDAADVIAAEAGSAIPPAHKPTFGWSAVIAGARSSTGDVLPLSALRLQRLGLVTTIARPSRVLTALQRAGLEPAVIEVHADHAWPRAKGQAGVDVWLTTAKCATKLGETYRSAPVLILDYCPNLPPELIQALVYSEKLASQNSMVECAPCSERAPIAG